MQLLEKNNSNAKGNRRITKLIDSYTVAVKKEGMIIGYLSQKNLELAEYCNFCYTHFTNGFSLAQPNPFFLWTAHQRYNKKGSGTLNIKMLCTVLPSLGR